ncbi:hypothetical protein B7Z17_05190, partial [Candidatus Saccharibacteria bacterium 32-49-10]
MTLLEHELNRANVELANNSAELVKYREEESKFIISGDLAARATAGLVTLAETGTEIQQVYLSSPEDEFNLRVRRSKTADGDEKKRVELSDAVTIDFINGYDFPLVEIEHADPLVRSELEADLRNQLGETSLVNVTGDVQFDNEYLAHKLSDNRDVAPERKASPESLDTFVSRVRNDMVAHYVSGRNQVVIGLTGMSGSGKSTVTRRLQEEITELFGDEYAPIVLSTDDYHFGKKALEKTYGAPYSDWDAAKTYNTEALAADVSLLGEQQAVAKRHFDFATEEPAYTGEVAPSPFVIIEGLYAGSADLGEVRTAHYELPTSIATSVGRDVRRLVIENRANRVFPTPESRLRYQIESALPLYLEQDKPAPNSRSASIRPLAERA